MAILIRQIICTVLLGLFAAAFCSPPVSHAKEGLLLVEQKVKAGLLYNFLKYTDWPAGTLPQSKAMVVCIIGGDPFDGELQPMTERTVNQHDIQLRNIHSAAEVSGCHLLYINTRAAEDWPHLRDSLAGQSVLTVSDMKDFTQLGGMIQFSRRDNRISVEINQQAIAAAQLQVQDRLLRLTTLAQPGPNAGNR